ncbi:hypothetical protein TSAR_007673 [Trichomalopsis sarcophagae]|uniref:Uncharacterized protein n=1 Tax=Trichomalopsis sarcophagae TaxID=543379 RepID=A0A232F4S7_9HYME|nr:hypothetical protein TSAR_007673 [Trichomalopsis sarcophagae]
MRLTVTTTTVFPLLIVLLVLVVNAAYARPSKAERERLSQLLQQQCDELAPKINSGTSDEELKNYIQQPELVKTFNKDQIITACKYKIYHT